MDILDLFCDMQSNIACIISFGSLRFDERCFPSEKVIRNALASRTFSLQHGLRTTKQSPIIVV